MYPEPQNPDPYTRRLPLPL